MTWGMTWWEPEPCAEPSQLNSWGLSYPQSGHSVYAGTQSTQTGPGLVFQCSSLAFHKHWLKGLNLPLAPVGQTRAYAGSLGSPEPPQSLAERIVWR